jgi:hypothetical protein
VRWVNAKMVAHPFRTLLQPLERSNPSAAALSRTYIYCPSTTTGRSLLNDSPSAHRASRGGGTGSWQQDRMRWSHSRDSSPTCCLRSWKASHRHHNRSLGHVLPLARSNRVSLFKDRACL